MSSARPTWRRTNRPKPRRWDARARRRELSARRTAGLESRQSVSAVLPPEWVTP